jgi:DNA-binding MarR family transcriptional regulator|nr:MarR family winged helix-turn-helix transcriptional regulator [Kofleriaceae bacterium]
MQDDPVRASLPHAVVRAFRLVNRASNRLFKPVGLSAEQAHVLSVLWALGPMTIGALQRELALSSPTLTGAIDRMAAMELVRRVPSKDDARASVLECTAGAAKKRRKIESTIDAIDDTCFAALTAGERAELSRLLDKVCAALE